MECEGLVARPVFKTGLRSRSGRGGSIPPHSAVGAVSNQLSAVSKKPEVSLPVGGAALCRKKPLRPRNIRQPTKS